VIGNGFELVHLARWNEGIVLPPSSTLRSVKSVVKARLTWAAREPGSGARQCLDQLLEGRSLPRRVTHRHHGVTEAVASGWADAGICVQLVGMEAGLRFLPVQEEAYEVCIPTAYADDRRIKAFLNVIRSKSYRHLLGQLPGFDTSETGDVISKEK
jgi:molybdate-binding protein